MELPSPRLSSAERWPRGVRLGSDWKGSKRHSQLLREVRRTSVDVRRVCTAAKDRFLERYVEELKTRCTVVILPASPVLADRECTEGRLALHLGRGRGSNARPRANFYEVGVVLQHPS